MSDIVSKMKQEIINRSNSFEEQTKGTKDEYNIYREHIQYVYKYVCLLSKDKNVDHEVLELSALLHDIAMTDRNLDRAKHNEYGAEIAEQLLQENNYSENKVEFVKKCILNHSSKRAEYRTTEEEKIKLYKKILDCLKENGQFINCDKIAQTEEIEENQLYELENNIENHRHIDTPLTVEHEIEVLKRVGFGEITLSNVDKEDYSLIKARKI